MSNHSLRVSVYCASAEIWYFAVLLLVDNHASDVNSSKAVTVKNSFGKKWKQGRRQRNIQVSHCASNWTQYLSRTGFLELESIQALFF